MDVFCVKISKNLYFTMGFITKVLLSQRKIVNKKTRITKAIREIFNKVKILFCLRLTRS